uniref:G protein-coupled receptor n=1 Tax=Panagrellus redivivus TaxID=6233 RepID=A0A7E4W425_PANRE
MYSTPKHGYNIRFPILPPPTLSGLLLIDPTIPTIDETSRNPTSDDIIVGILMSVVSLICIFPNVIVMHAIKADKDLFRLNAYKFMFVLNIFDILQLVAHFITGFFNIFQTIGNHTFAKMLGAIATPSYITYAVLTVMLSINRLTQICFPYYDQYLFSPFAMKVWIGTSFLFFAMFAIALASPWATIIYLPEYWSWDYDKSDDYPASWYVQRCEMVIEIGGIPISGVIYLIVFGTLIKKTFLPATNLAYSCLNFMWIINGAVNPVIYYIVNAYVRNRRIAHSVPVAPKKSMAHHHGHGGATTTAVTMVTSKHGTAS